ncbi:hypothetical protein ACFY1U_03915 [Streptomyces sp. NPDC001351]
MTQNLLSHPSATTHWTGRAHGFDTQAVLTGLGLTPAVPTPPREEGVL